ncbi:MAG TPA: cytochrome c [Sphingomonadales bacterium]
MTFRFPHRVLPAAAALLGAALLLAACGEKEAKSPEQARLDKGRTLYTLRCASCHNPADPRKDGGVGPAVAGSSLELLDARLNHAGYPEGYAPKRATRVMPKLPHTAEELEALHAFLNSF